MQAGEARFDLLNGNSILYFQQAKTLTEGANPNNDYQQSSYGYDGGSFGDPSNPLPNYGSISPNTYLGQYINGVKYIVTNTFDFATTTFVTTHYFTVNLMGSLPQNFFSAISNSDIGIKYTNNTTGFSNSLTDNNGVPYTVWSWVLPSSPPTWEGTGTQLVDFL